VSQSISPLTTRAKSPSVTMINGKVRIFSTGRMKAFTTPNTSATPKNGSAPPSKLTPGTIRVATQSAAALTSNRMKNGIEVLFPLPADPYHVSTD